MKKNVKKRINRVVYNVMCFIKMFVMLWEGEDSQMWPLQVLTIPESTKVYYCTYSTFCNISCTTSTTTNCSKELTII